MENVFRYKEARHVTLISAVINLWLGLIKLFFGWLGSSQALIADGVHSLSDLITDALVLFAARIGAQAADSDHPYGHGRIETAASVALAVLLIIVGLGILIDAGVHLFGFAARHKPSWYVLVIAFVSVFANEWLYRYTMKIAKRINSNLLRANAWHNRSDALSSLVVLIGVGGSLLGFTWMDALAAAIVSLMIIKMGWNIGWSSVRELVDTGLDEAMLAKIQQQITSVAGVRALHMLRTRLMAGDILVDVHILVEPRVSVSEGHYIGDQVRNALVKGVSEVKDVTVHVDPEDDEVVPVSDKLPRRDEMLAMLQARWGDIEAFKSMQGVTLHYLSGKIHIEVLLPIEMAANRDKVADLTQQFRQAIKDQDFIASVKLLFC